MLPPDHAREHFTAGEAARIAWRQVAAAITDLLVVVDAAGHTIYFNEQLAAALGRPLRPDIAVDAQSVLYGLYRADGSLFPPNELPVNRALLENRRISDVEVVFHPPDGPPRITRWNAAPLHDEAGQVSGAVGTGHDVTAQTHARQWLQASERRALLLAELSGQLAASLDLREVVSRVAQITASNLGDWCMIELADESSPPRFRNAAIQHRDAIQLRRVRRARQRHPLTTDHGLVARLLLNRAPLWLRDVDSALLAGSGEGEWTLLRQLNPRDLFILPLIAHQRLLGLLLVGRDVDGHAPAFSDDDYALAQEVASRAALAIENAQLYGRTRRQVARLAALSEVALAFNRSLVLADSGPPALAALVKATRTDLGYFYVLDESGQAITQVAAVGCIPENQPPAREFQLADDWLADQLVVRRAPVYSGDGVTVLPAANSQFLATWGMKSFLAVPILLQEEVLGTLLLLSARRSRFYPADLHFLQSAANQIAVSINNARLYEHTRALLAEVELSNQLKDEFISIASHELRTPITAVRGYAELLVRRLGKETGREADIKTVETIHAQADRMTRLIADLLDVSRASSGTLELRPQRMDLANLVRQVVDGQQPLAPQHLISVQTSPASIIGTWDAGRLEQVLLNLLGNAVKYSPNNGPILIRVTGDPFARCVRLTVHDQGIGIPAGDVPQLFTRFYRAANARLGRSGGLGVGLYVSRELVRAHGGDIAVESDLGVGSTFTITLPWPDES